MLALAFLHDHAHQQIATHTGTPLDTVKTHIRRGITTLRTHISTESP
ncbi:sigma factor-like helix-turn-helix DNA-binding protein [Streptomyces sp. CA-251247]